MTSPTEDERTIEQITAAFPGWRVWRPKRRDDKPPSSWVATRLQERAGTDPTVLANTAEELRTALAEQREAVELSGRRPVAAGDPDAFPAELGKTS